MAKDDFIRKVQAQLKAAEASQARANRKLALLHETLADGLEKFGTESGCSADVVAEIVTPKEPD